MIEIGIKYLVILILFQISIIIKVSNIDNNPSIELLSIIVLTSNIVIKLVLIILARLVTIVVIKLKVR